MAYSSRKECQNKLYCGKQLQVSFCVPLTFGQELIAATGGVLVPLSTVAQNTDGVRGVLKLKFNQSLTQAIYKLYVFNATSPNNQITDAHLHLGTSNQNGPVTVDLYNGPNRNVNGLLSSGFINNGDITGVSATGFPVTNNVSSIYSAIRDGAIYANVHSTAFPGGIVRGQIYLPTY